MQGLRRLGRAGPGQRRLHHAGLQLTEQVGLYTLQVALPLGLGLARNRAIRSASEAAAGRADLHGHMSCPAPLGWPAATVGRVSLPLRVANPLGQHECR